MDPKSAGVLPGTLDLLILKAISLERLQKYYRLTRTGQRRFQEETAGWERLATARTAALGATPDEV